MTIDFCATFKFPVTNNPITPDSKNDGLPSFNSSLSLSSYLLSSTTNPKNAEVNPKFTYSYMLILLLFIYTTMHIAWR